jgi:hypothetical protein
MWSNGLPVRELTLPLLLVSGYSAVCHLPVIIERLNADNAY